MSKLFSGVAAIGLCFTLQVFSDPVVYDLHNHPDGNQAPPLYGLRLDELVDVTGGHDVFTFDFDHISSSMSMVVDGSMITISGTAFGGLDIGGSYDVGNSGLWNINFVYNSVSQAPGDDDLHVATGFHSNIGTITRQSDSAVFYLQDEAGANPYSFRLGDEDDDNGHRGFAGTSGWGWLNYSDTLGAPGEVYPHVYDSDWLFTAEVVPEPATLMLMVISGSLVLFRRRFFCRC